MQVRRLGDGPIITADLCDSIGTNIQGPSLIEAPPWLDEPLGRYYLYFADHKGGHIRLAYADVLTGPWTVYRPGALQLADSCFLTEPPTATDEQIATLRDRYVEVLGPGFSLDGFMVDEATPHIASPDVHVDHKKRQVLMYFHGLERFGVQVTRLATSTDGVHFDAHPEVLGSSYFRVFRHGDFFYALVMPGQLMRSRDGRTNFEKGPKLFGPTMRHSAVRLRDKALDVFWTRVGDAPESILHSSIELTDDWTDWNDAAAQPVLGPEAAWEGSQMPVEPSVRGAVHGPVNQLRDPAIFVEADRTYLLYSGAGESCIGIAEITW